MYRTLMIAAATALGLAAAGAQAQNVPGDGTLRSGPGSARDYTQSPAYMQDDAMAGDAMTKDHMSSQSGQEQLSELPGSPDGFGVTAPRYRGVEDNWSPAPRRPQGGQALSVNTPNEADVSGPRLGNGLYLD